MNREFEKGETYFLSAARVGGSQGFVIFRPDSTQSEGDKICGAAGIIRCQCFSNLNSHWGKGEEAFVRKSDGTNTYPWTLSSRVSVWNRSVRLATAEERMILDSILERGEALTSAEIRDIKIGRILEAESQN